MKRGFLVIWLAFLTAVLITIFWYTEGIYNLPTPVPQNHKSIAIGTQLKLDLDLPENSKPVFLHFFNPDCPCSRFNFRHFKELVNEYGGQVNFAVVLMTQKDYTEKEIQEKYDINIPIIQNNSIAKQCGVYSTPQAVIIKTDNTLHYRGNYNKSRYCTDKKSNYAQLAIEQLINKKPRLPFDQFALKAYGCQLPGCTK